MATKKERHKKKGKRVKKGWKSRRKRVESVWKAECGKSVERVESGWEPGQQKLVDEIEGETRVPTQAKHCVNRWSRIGYYECTCVCVVLIQMQLLNIMMWRPTRKLAQSP